MCYVETVHPVDAGFSVFCSIRTVRIGKRLIMWDVNTRSFDDLVHKLAFRPSTRPVQQHCRTILVYHRVEKVLQIKFVT